MKKKVLLLTLTLLLVIGVVQVASAAGWGAGAGQGPRALSADNWTSLADTLGLTDEQAAKIQQLEKNTYDQTRALRDRLGDAMFELRQLRWQKNVDKATVEARIQEVNDLRSQLYNIKQSAWEERQSILTQEQLDKLESMRGFCGRHGGMGRGGFGGPQKAQ
ncbi:MAG: periplasmic heavy metal sensor [Bacillota bacterium]|nr:periplasmic heavy metal sensor [Bacillota bacterium]